MAAMKKTKQLILPDRPGSRDGAEAFLARVRNADEPLGLIAPLSPQDLLISYEEADDEERGGLLALADTEQMRGVVDLKCWNGYLPALDALEAFVEPLASTGLEGADKALEDIEPELRTLLLKKYATVHLREDKDDEVPAQEGSELISCSDGYYFIELREPDDVPDVVRQLLSALLNRSFEAYQRELECVRHDMPSDLQESALKWRNGRLADQGFGTLEESMQLLAPVDPELLRRRLEVAEGMPYPLSLESSVPAIYVENMWGADLLDRSLGLLAESTDERLRSRADSIGAELGMVTSLYLTATGCDLGNVEAMESSTRWARNTIALGLDAVTKGDPQMGARALAQLVPAEIFRAGMGLLIPLRGRARKLFADRRLSVTGVAGMLLDSPHWVAAHCLAREIPARWPRLEDGGDLSIEPAEPLPHELEGFERVDQVGRASMLLDEAEMVGDLLFEGLKWDPSSRQGPSGKVASSIVLTALANAHGGRDLTASPVSQEQAEDFCRRALEQDSEAFCADVVMVLAPLLEVEPDGVKEPHEEQVAARRLLLRLARFCRTRIETLAPILAVLVG